MRTDTPKYQMTMVTKADAIARCLASDPTASEWNDDILNVFDRFAKLDPTHLRQQKPFHYLEWMAKEYLKTHQRGQPFPSFRFAELTEALRIFDKYNHKRPEHLRDINKYNLHSLIREIDDWRNARRWEIDDFVGNAPEEVIAETTILYDGPEGVALVPHSRFASDYWGQHTVWCTIEIEDGQGIKNRFHDFNQRGSLVILMPIEDKYYQAHDKTIRTEKNIDILHMNVELDRLIKKVRVINPELLQYELSDKSTNDAAKEVCTEKWEKRILNRMARAPKNLDLVFNALSKIEDVRKVVLMMDGNLLKDKDFILEAMEYNIAIGEYRGEELKEDVDILLEMVRGNIFYEEIVPREIWQTIDPDIKKDIFETALSFDWNIVGFAPDFGVELSIDRQIDILHQALGQASPENVRKHLHLFPALREAVLFHQLNEDEALDFLYQQSTPPSFDHNGPFLPRPF